MLLGKKKKWILNILKLQLRNLCFERWFSEPYSSLWARTPEAAPVSPRATPPTSVSLQRWRPQPRHHVKHPCFLCTGFVSLLHSSDSWAISSEKKAPERPEAKVTLSIIVQNSPPLFFFSNIASPLFSTDACYRYVSNNNPLFLSCSRLDKKNPFFLLAIMPSSECSTSPNLSFGWGTNSALHKHSDPENPPGDMGGYANSVGITPINPVLCIWNEFQGMCHFTDSI